MRLKTVAGAYAGEIRDYTFSAAQAALSTGTAVPLADEPLPPRLRAFDAPTPAVPHGPTVPSRMKRTRAKE